MVKSPFIKSCIFAAAIAAIRSYPKAITSFEEVADIRGVGAKMAEKIRELLAYGKISKVNEGLTLYFSVWAFFVHHKKLTRFSTFWPFVLLSV